MVSGGGDGVRIQILFWNVTSLIFKGVKRVGGLGERADPAGGDWIGVKKGALGAAVLLRDIIAKRDLGKRQTGEMKGRAEHKI